MTALRSRLLLSEASNLQIVFAVFLAGLTIFVWKLVRHRLQWRSMRYPGPPHDFFFGHLLLLRKYRKRFNQPGQANGYTALEMTKEYGTVIWVDLWPLKSVCICADPEVADTAIRLDNVPKALHTLGALFPVIGSQSIVLADSTPAGNAHWRVVRKGFAKGLRKARLEKECVCDILAGVRSFLDLVGKRCTDGESFLVFDHAVDATVDIILKLTLGETTPQLRRDVLAILDRQLKNAATASRLLPLKDALNPMRRLRERRTSKQMDGLFEHLIRQHLDQALLCKEKEDKDLLDFLLSESIMDFDDVASQVKTLIFGGHHTTSSSLSWAFYHVATEAGLTQRLREEIASVYGSTDDLLSNIAAEPHRLSDLRLLDGVIKESLRLHPPASSTRQPAADYIVRTHKGSYPLGPTFLWIMHFAMHSHPDNWDEPDTFKPERWLDEANKHNSAWQPFSKGPKNCVGLELALMEQRMILAAAVCRYDLTYAAKQPPYLKGGLTAGPSNKVPLYAERRNAN